MMTFATNAELIEFLYRDGTIQSRGVYAAMMRTDRANYMPATDISQAYINRPHGIGYGATISQPAMHATCLEYLKDRLYAGAHVLDVGCGSGYLTAVMAEMVGENGRVTAIDYIQSLVDFSRANIAKDKGSAWLDSTAGRIDCRVGDGWKGDPTQKFDCIHVGAAAAEVPAALVDQLKYGGRMVVPVGKQDSSGNGQTLAVVDKDGGGKVAVNHVMHVQYVPLVHPEQQVYYPSHQQLPRAEV